MPVEKRESRLELTAVDKASGVINQVKGSVDGLRSSLDTCKNVMAALGIVAGTVALKDFILNITKTDAAFVDLSVQTGASVENLSKLSAIAKIGGADFNGFTDQLGRMVKGLKSGNDEGQLASHALAFLGVKAKDANGVFRDTGDIAFDVAKALAKYADDGNKVALVQDALGKGAQRYLPFLKEMVQFGDQNAITTAEQARQAKEFEIEVNRMNLALEAGRRGLVVEYIPALTRFIEQMVEGTRIAGGFGAAIRMLSGINPGPSIAQNIRATEEELAAWQQAGAVGRFFQKPLGATYAGTEGDLRGRIEFLKFMQRQSALEGRTGEQFWDARDYSAHMPSPSSGYQSPDLHASELETKLYTRALQQLEEELGKLNDLSKAQIVINRLVAGSWQGIKDPEKQAALIATAGDYDDRQAQIQRITAEYTALGQLIQRQQEEDALLQRAGVSNKMALDQRSFEIGLIGRTAFEQQRLTALRAIDLETRERIRQATSTLPEDAMGGDIERIVALYTAAGEAQKQSVLRQLQTQRDAERSFVTGSKQAFNDYAENATNAALQARMVFGNAFQNMEDALVSFARTGKLNFRNFADSLIEDILRIQTRMYITGPLAQMGSDLFSSALPAIGSGIGSLFGFANGGVMGGGGSMPLTRYAGGGVATSPQLAMFGEGSSPEAFVPLNDGRSIPVTMRGGMGGGTTSYYILPVVSGDSYAEVHAALRSIDSNFDSRAIAAVFKAAQSRGKRLF